MGHTDLKKYLVTAADSIRAVIEIIDRNKDGIALVVNEDGRLTGTITDGDIRRFLLAGHSVEENCEKAVWKSPVVAPAGASPEQLKQILNLHRIKSVPVVDDQQRPISVVHLQELLSSLNDGLRTAVVMAGGEGRRLRPITENIPKPMIEVGGRPVLESIVSGLAKNGIENIHISLNYMGEMIENHFGDGSRFNVKIDYLRESKKLGTAGALSLLQNRPANPFLVMNGDVLTKVNYQRLFDFHKQHRAALTVAAAMYHFRIPYGVIEAAGHFVLGLEEKPSRNFLCNAGIYIVDPELLDHVPVDQSFNMTDLMERAIKSGLPVAAFPIHEYWLDIGQKEDLDKAKNDAMSLNEGNI